MNRRYRAPDAGDLHRAWLSLVEPDGPFLSVPALLRVWPHGIPTPKADALARLREAKPAFEKAWENWDITRGERGHEAALELYRTERDIWVELVLRDVIGWGAHLDLDSARVADVAATSPNRAVTTCPSGALVRGEEVAALVMVVDPADSLRDPLDDGWAASPIDRMEELLRGGPTSIGVVTDGRWWALVSAQPETMAASGVIDAHTWIEEPQARNAFLEILQRKRLVGGKPEDRLPTLFTESVAAAEEITEALGVQVRRAVELLVQAMSEGALTATERGETDPLPDDRAEVYEAAVTVMMRVVFLLFAEERGLLPENELFALGYGMAGRLDELERREREEGAEALDSTRLTWHRLLATSQALYRGASFEDLRLPSYGGSLFDPDRYPFLMARGEAGTLAIAISDRVMLAVLRSVQVAELHGQPARRISFRDIDVEQIGYIYEGLLGYTTTEVDEVILGLIGSRGEEPEIPLAELERLAAEHDTDAALAGAILAWCKQHQSDAKPRTKAAITKALGATLEDAERALRVVARDEALRERLRPFLGVIRRDLRDRPMVVHPRGVLVTETPSRSSAGAHYTPRSLAEEVVRHALEPKVYQPGPYDTPDESTWRLLSSEQLLDLKVADIACGSGAFLVAAARYLAARLVEAWRDEGVAAGTPYELHTHAIRQVVANCLYGADINGMAVEMCKLSLWLVSLDPKLPFSFVDDKVLHGNALLGLTDPRQLKELHITPGEAGPEALFEVTADHRAVARMDVDGVLKRAAALRRSLASEVNEDDPQRSATTKRRQWRRYQDLTEQLATVADAVVAAGLRLGGKPGKKLNQAYDALRGAVAAAYPDDGEPADRGPLEEILTAGLTPTVPTDYERWKPLHWFLAVPDVTERGGFDVVVGNPPFLGGSKLTGSMGTNVRDWFVNDVAEGVRGTADLVAYFFLRAKSLLNGQGSLGLIATNTVAQGDTREVGLDRMVASGFTITRAIQSKSWPSAAANLEFAAVWGTHGTVASDVAMILDDIPVAKIATLLEPTGRVDGHPVRLAENIGIAFKGVFALGMGFVLTPEEARSWIDAAPRNAEVLFPYLNGEDLNSRPDQSAPRWVIDFKDRTEDDAQRYRIPYNHILHTVKPIRAKNAIAYRRDYWWQFAKIAPAMRKAIASLDEVLTIARVSRSVMPLRLPNKQVLSEQVVVFATDSFADQAVLSSSLHQTWAIKYGSGMRNDPRYTPTDVFQTFPRPTPTDRLAAIGHTLDTERREIMLRRDLGLTKLYNLSNDPDVADSTDRDVARLREIHVELDTAVMAAYGWDDVPLDHGFHTYRQMRRWTVSPTARVEILDRLLEENHRRAAAQAEAPPSVADETADDEDEDT